VRHALNALSNLYRRAQSEGKVPPGFSPVAAMMDKPSGARREAKWLEVPDAALLLEAARTLPADPSRGDALPAEIAHAILATFLLTGGRSAEVLGLEVDDVSFDQADRYLPTERVAAPEDPHVGAGGAALAAAGRDPPALCRPRRRSPVPVARHREGIHAD
jgi:integrase